MIGNGANVPSGNTGATNRTAIGFGAIANTNNTVVLGNAAVSQVWMAFDKQAVIYAGGLIINELSTAPTSKTAAGTKGDIRFTADYIYICTVGGAAGVANWNRVAVDDTAW